MKLSPPDAASFLKSTLRLPKSTFPARPDPASLPKYLAACTTELYAWNQANSKDKQVFRIHDGPPYANGDLHVGHALNKIVKDIINRWKLSNGYKVEYIPGWDCHGLPIELKALEQPEAVIGQVKSPTTIRAAARAFAQHAVDKQMAEFKSWAVMGDWDGHWKTMDKEFELRQLYVFRDMVANGLIYRKHKPVYWSISSRTALAEAELEYKEDHVSQAAYVKFLVKGLWTSETEGQEVNALIWTTTPWTLPANQAIAVNRDFQYSIVRSQKHGLLLVATARLEQLAEMLGEMLETVVNEVDVEQLLHARYDGLSVFGDQALNRPIIHADFVSAESGTGLVHCAPGHGMEDYLALQPQIQSGRVSVRAPVDDAGRFDATASPQRPGLLEGKDIFNDGNLTVLSLLSAQKKLVHHASFRHKYPIDWRTKQPVIIRATAQWFADLSHIKQSALEALEGVTFVPESGRSRLRSFVEGRTEWCISRQRAWGVPIPAIYHTATGEAVLNNYSIRHIMSVIEERGIDAWWSDPPDEQAWILPSLGSSSYVRGRDTMDVWFDSGTSWTGMREGYSTRKDGKSLADVYLEGTDQHRGWFQSSLLTHAAKQNHPRHGGPANPPFASLFTHGFTLDALGKKMSKSLGNVITPDQIIKGIAPPSSNGSARNPKDKRQQQSPASLGPDALRLWVASSDWRSDITISPITISTIHTSLAKHRVTFKLLLGLLQDSHHTPLHIGDATFVDRIALYHLTQMLQAVRSAYETHEFHKIVQAINKYIVTDLSGFYLEAVKDIMYCESLSSDRRKSATYTLKIILSKLLEILDPITPLLTQEVWDHGASKLFTEHGLNHLRTNLEPIQSYGITEHVIERLRLIRTVNSTVKALQEAARAHGLLGSSLASDVFIVTNDGALQAIGRNSWQEILVVSSVKIYRSEKWWEFNLDKWTAGKKWFKIGDLVDATDGEKVIGKVVVTSPAGEKCMRCWQYTVRPTDKNVTGAVATQEEVTATAEAEAGIDQSVVTSAPETPADAEAETPICDRCKEAVQEYTQSVSQQFGTATSEFPLTNPQSKSPIIESGLQSSNLLRRTKSSGTLRFQPDPSMLSQGDSTPSSVKRRVQGRIGRKEIIRERLVGEANQRWSATLRAALLTESGAVEQDGRGRDNGTGGRPATLVQQIAGPEGPETSSADSDTKHPDSHPNQPSTDQRLSPPRQTAVMHTTQEDKGKVFDLGSFKTQLLEDGSSSSSLRSAVSSPGSPSDLLPDKSPETSPQSLPKTSNTSASSSPSRLAKREEAGESLEEQLEIAGPAFREWADEALSKQNRTISEVRPELQKRLFGKFLRNKRYSEKRMDIIWRDVDFKNEQTVESEPSEGRHADMAGAETERRRTDVEEEFIDGYDDGGILETEGGEMTEEQKGQAEKRFEDTRERVLDDLQKAGDDEEKNSVR